MTYARDTKAKIARLKKSIALKERTLENLQSMDIADNGSTIELTHRILSQLRASLRLLTAQV